MARAYWKNLPRLKRKLELLRIKTADAVRPAMEQAASDLVEMMKRLAPHKSNALRDSIGWTWGEAPEGSIRVAVGEVGFMRITIYAGNAEAFYARWVEFGTAPHIQGGMFKGAQSPGTRAQPFFYPSYRASRKNMKKLVKNAVNKAVKEVAGIT